MRSIYIDSAVPENETKKTYNFPEFIMMENAAVALENAVMSFNLVLNKTFIDFLTKLFPNSWKCLLFSFL